MYLDLCYHQPREWERDGKIIIKWIDTRDNISDLGSKPCGPEEYRRFLMIMMGFAKWVIRFPQPTEDFVQ